MKHPRAKESASNALTGQFDRRSLLAGAGALALGLLPGSGYAQIVNPPNPTPALPTIDASSLDAGGELETFTGDEYGMSVEWDPESWQVRFEPTPGREFIGFYNADANLSNSFEDTYYFGVEYRPDFTWATIHDAAAHAQDAWFSQGMLGATIIETWQTDDAFGWFHTSDFQGARSLNFLEYSLTDLPGPIWRSIGVSIDGAIFDAERSLDLFSSISVDDESVPRVVAPDILVDLFDQHHL